MISLLSFTTALIFNMCSPRSEKVSETQLQGKMMNNDSLDKRGPHPDTYPLANRLMAIGYIGIFQGPDEEALRTLLNEPGILAALATLAGDPEAPALARFLAAEILFDEQEKYPPQEQMKQLASVYATALAQNFTEAANAWGLPGILGGPAGEHVEALGEAAIPELASLLDDDRRVYYEGSQEATLGNSYGYRVKDLAAFYISRIRNIPFELDQDPNERDKEIEKLKSAVR